MCPRIQSRGFYIEWTETVNTNILMLPPYNPATTASTTQIGSTWSKPQDFEPFDSTQPNPTLPDPWHFGYLLTRPDGDPTRPVTFRIPLDPTRRRRRVGSRPANSSANKHLNVPVNNPVKVNEGHSLYERLHQRRRVGLIRRAAFHQQIEQLAAPRQLCTVTTRRGRINVQRSMFNFQYLTFNSHYDSLFNVHYSIVHIQYSQ